MVKAVGDGASLLILLIMAFVTYEVVSRYVFNAPTSWVWPINKQLFGLFVLVAGGYALVHNSHIRIEMLYDHFPANVKAVIRWLSLAAAICFIGSLVWKSGLMALEAWNMKEVATGVFKLPLYPLKIAMPLGAALFLIACIAKTLQKK